MPKKLYKPHDDKDLCRKGYESWRSQNKHYFEHDDRDLRTNCRTFENRPRVSFKARTRPIMASRSLLRMDNDFVKTLNCDSDNRKVILRGNGRGLIHNRNNPLPHRGFRGGTLFRPLNNYIGEVSWYKITIPYGHKYTKDYILNSLLNYMEPETFIPIMYKISGNEATFYVDDQKTANALFNCDYKITVSDGFKLQVKVKPGIPRIQVDDKLKEKLKQVLAKRYVRETNALDLSKFHHDSDLVNDYFCALFQSLIFMTIINIISEHIPSLEALNLDGNKLFMIRMLNILHTKFPKLKILYIGDNKIKSINELDAIKNLKLEELRLAGNPCCDKYKSRQNDYVSDVRERFPKLLRLDGIELPRPILFDVVDDSTEVPSTKRIYVTNGKAQEVASQFLQQYFMIYDSENRQPLLDAYEEHAYFSLTISIHPHNVNKLSEYIPESRNLFRITDSTKRQKLLKQGRLPVVSFISKLPRTKHYLNTFTMDISLVTDGMMLITVTGLFKELNNKDDLIRYFNRTFLIVPEGNGYCIRNEHLHINHPTETQQKYISSHSLDVQMSDTSSTVKTSPDSTVQGIVSQLPEDVKQQMTLTLSQQTNMNLEWSLKCLQEVQWNYENAVSVFQEFFKRGQIPSEAFNK